MGMKRREVETNGNEKERGGKNGNEKERVGNEAALSDGGQIRQHALNVYVMAGYCVWGGTCVNICDVML